MRRVGGGPVKTRISPDGGVGPVWRADGRELFYVAGDQTLVSVAWNPSMEDLDAARPVPLFRMTSEQQEHPDSFDVSPGGQTFAHLEPLARPGPPSQITVSLGWLASLR